MRRPMVKLRPLALLCAALCAAPAFAAGKNPAQAEMLRLLDRKSVV